MKNEKEILIAELPCFSYVVANSFQEDLPEEIPNSYILASLTSESEPEMPLLIKKQPSVAFSGEKADIVREVEKYDWDVKIALAIIKCESNFNTQVISHTNDAGIFQINLSAHWDDIPGIDRNEKIIYLQNYHNNIAFAYQLYSKRNNWNDWVCYTKKMLSY